MQTQRYPLPPLFLTEIVDNYVEIRGDDARNVRVYKIEEGYGVHVHDDPADQSGCLWRERFDRDTNTYVMVPRESERDCLRWCEDSDWLVRLEYEDKRGQTWEALYGVKRHGDIQQFSLWAD